MAKKEKTDPFEKLMALTKMVKEGKVTLKKKGEPKATKWRSAEPKFTDKKKPDNTVQAGGMDVDPSLQQEYENFRKDKEERESRSSFKIERKKDPEPPI